MSPLSHGAFSGRSRHQSCKPWFYPIPQPNKLLQHLVLEKDTTSNKDRTGTNTPCLTWKRKCLSEAVVKKQTLGKSTCAKEVKPFPAHTGHHVCGRNVH